MRKIVFDYSNSYYIHKFLGNEVIRLPKDEFNFNYDLVYFADNYNISINLAIEKAFKTINKKVIIFNSPVINRWGNKRDYAFKIMKNIFKDTNNVRILDWRVYRDLDKIDWDREEGVIKKLNSDAGYKTTFIFKNSEELENTIKNFREEYENGIVIQEYCDGEEIAFGTIFIDSEPIFPYYVSFEYKKSISNEIGGNTGQSAEFGFFTNNEYGKEILLAISDYLKRNKIKYNGVIDINGAYKDGYFYPFEFTVSRDGYPEIVSFLFNNRIEDILNKKVNWKGFRYILVVRRDIIESDNKKVEFKVNEEILKEKGLIWIPECKYKDDVYYTDKDVILGLIYKESEVFEEIEFNTDIFTIPVIVYVSFNEDNKRKMEIFRWLYEEEK